MPNKQELEDKLKALVFSGNDTTLFDEALSCYIAGFNRASYIVAWITIVESLKNKIEQLANLNDGIAITAFAKIVKLEKEEQSTDKVIIEQSEVCNIVDGPELHRLNFLWKQRCLFAHPYNTHPTKEQLEHILHETVNITLGRPINFNKAYLTDFCDRIVNYPHFLTLDADAVRSRYVNVLARVTEQNHSFLFKTIIAKIGTIESDVNKKNELLKLRYFMLELLLKNIVPLDDPSFGLEDRITKFPFTCINGIVLKGAWLKIPEKEQIMLFDYMESENERHKKIRIYNRIGLIYDELVDTLQDRFNNQLNKEPLHIAMSLYKDSTAAFNRIVEEYKNPLFDIQNNIADILRDVEGKRFLETLTEEQNLILGRLLKRSANANAYSSKTFLSHVLSHTSVFPDAYIVGIGTGYLLPSNHVQYMPEHKELEKATSVIEDFNDALIIKAYDMLVYDIENNLKHSLFSSSEFADFKKELVSIVGTLKTAHAKAFEKYAIAIKLFFENNKITR